MNDTPRKPEHLVRVREGKDAAGRRVVVEHFRANYCRPTFAVNGKAVTGAEAAEAERKMVGGVTTTYAG